MTARPAKKGLIFKTVIVILDVGAVVLVRTTASLKKDEVFPLWNFKETAFLLLGKTRGEGRKIGRSLHSNYLRLA